MPTLPSKYSYITECTVLSFSMHINISHFRYFQEIKSFTNSLIQQAKSENLNLPKKPDIKIVNRGNSLLNFNQPQKPSNIPKIMPF